MELELNTNYMCIKDRDKYWCRRDRYNYSLLLKNYGCYYCSNNPNCIDFNFLEDMEDKLLKYSNGIIRHSMVIRLKNCLLRGTVERFEELRYLSPYYLSRVKNIGKVGLSCLFIILNNYFDGSTKYRTPFFDYSSIDERKQDSDWLLPGYTMKFVEEYIKYINNLVGEDLNEKV